MGFGVVLGMFRLGVGWCWVLCFGVDLGFYVVKVGWLGC